MTVVDPAVGLVVPDAARGAGDRSRPPEPVFHGTLDQDMAVTGRNIFWTYFSQNGP